MPSAVKLYFSWTWGDSDRRTRRWELDTSVVPRRNGFFARVGDPRASRSSFAAHFTVPAVVYRVVTVVLLVPSRLYGLQCFQANKKTLAWICDIRPKVLRRKSHVPGYVMFCGMVLLSSCGRAT